MIIGVLHPGAMGSQLARTARVDVVWAGDRRSPASHERARRNGLEDVGSVEEVARRADVVVSICPPSVAERVASQVASARFGGIYVEANAVSPATSAKISRNFERFVDASVIGPPPVVGGTTRLYLAGDDAEVVGAIWEGSDLEPVVMNGPVGAASAIKMAYAGWTKGSAALLVTMAAYAESAGIREALAAEWARSIPDLSERLRRTAAGVGPKAWRFAGEMEEIAAALEAEDLPPGFHEAASEIYTRLTDLERMESPEVEQVIASLFD